MYIRFLAIFVKLLLFSSPGQTLKLSFELLLIIITGTTNSFSDRLATSCINDIVQKLVKI